jgi:hypothetical protein
MGIKHVIKIGTNEKTCKYIHVYFHHAEKKGQIRLEERKQLEQEVSCKKVEIKRKGIIKKNACFFSLYLE